MDKQTFLSVVGGIPHDRAAIKRGIELRDNRYKPILFSALLAVDVLAIAFAAVNMTRVYQSYGSYETTAILYTVLMGIAVGAFSLVDLLYVTGTVGIRWGEGGIPYALYLILRRDCTYTFVCPEMYQYIRPGMYHDDRVPCNNVAVWTTRVCTPFLYALSLFVYWGIYGGRTASPDTVDGLQFVFGNVLLAVIGVTMVTTVTTNMYGVLFKRWDYVPESVGRNPAHAAY
jgi:hypothetical protein